MGKTAILTDASADIPQEFLEKYDITVVPVLIVFEDKTYKTYGATGELPIEEYYKRVEKEIPTTAIPSPGVIMKSFESALEKADSVIGIVISHKLSGFYSSAFKIANEVLKEKDVSVFDCGKTSVSMGAIVVEAARLAKKGKAKEEIIEKLEKWIPQTRFAGIMFTLENLVRTGRIAKTKKVLADFFKMKPVVAMEEGEVKVKGRIRAKEELIISQMKRFGEKALQNMHEDNNTIFIGHTRWLEAAEEIAEYMREHNPHNKEVIVQETGTLIANFVGRKTLTLGYIGKYDDNWLLKTKK